jgi:hypothetical protein
MTELERARKLLRENQDALALERLDQDAYGDDHRVRYYEDCVLAALSWVWDAQQRSRRSRVKKEYGFWPTRALVNAVDDENGS